MSNRTKGNPACTEIRVCEEYDVSRARVAVTKLATSIGMERGVTYRLVTAVSELGTNLVFHADHGGMIHIRPLFLNGRWGIEVQADDDGPGIANLELAMRDGYSTSGSLGSGLPGCRRLVSDFQISSQPGVGTHVVIRQWI